MPKIFISYRRADTQYVTDSIYDHLIHAFDEKSVFLDVGSIPIGVDFRRYLYQQVQGHDVVLVVIGPDWARIMNERAPQANDFVRIEIENALQLKKLVIPVLVMNAEMPDFSGLPSSIQDLQWRNSARVRRHPDLKSDCLRLAEGIRQSFTDEDETDEDIDLTLPYTPFISRMTDILPPPFGWVDIPSGKVALEGGGAVPTTGQLFNVPGFSMSKYPITNAQFAHFMEAGGYQCEKWWTQAGWQLKESENWSKPRFWSDEYWNQPDCPVVGISWYEALAFCSWLTDELDEEILLPTEQQWQRAAQGDTGRVYPWGQDWDEKRCNNCVKPHESLHTTPVTRYEGRERGDSPFGVVDMAGNVWEWCLNAYNTSNRNLSGINLRVLRGGSWRTHSANTFRTTSRSWNDPTHWDNTTGFRIVRL